MPQSSDVFARRISTALVGDTCRVSSSWMEGGEVSGVSAETLIEKEEAMERSILEVCDGIWVAGWLRRAEGSGYMGEVRLRDMHQDPSGAISVLSRLASSVAKAMSRIDRVRLIPVLSYSCDMFAEFDVYSAAIELVTVPCPPQK